MTTPAFNIYAGDTISSGNFSGIVASIQGSNLIVLPVLNAGEQRYRGDVEITEFADMLQVGLGGMDLVIRVCRPVSLQASAAKKIGRLSDKIQSLVRKASDRECIALATEAKWRVFS